MKSYNVGGGAISKERKLYIPAPTFSKLYLLLSDAKIKFKENYETTINGISDSTEVLEATQKLSSKQEQILNSQQKELENFDISTVLKLDQKVAEQQVTLEQAGVAGFYVTKNPTEIKVQMVLLDFISQLEEKEMSGQLDDTGPQFNSDSHRSEIQYGYSSGSNNSASWW